MRDARVARLAEKDAELRAVFRPGLVYWLEYRAKRSAPATWVKMVIEQGNGDQRRRITFSEMERERWQKSFLVDLTAFERPRPKGTGLLSIEDAEYYRAAPEIAPVLEMSTEAKIGLVGWAPIFADNAPVLRGWIQDGKLTLYEVVQQETYQPRTELPPGVRVNALR